jgi:response regulator NasT
MSALKVLVIDEIKADKLLEQTLQKHGYDVAILSLQSLNISQVVLSLLPDIIVLNLYTPTRDILRAILDINQSYSVPVVMFAEDQDTETINQVIKAGVSAYIVNGLESKRVKSIIDIAIARFKEQQLLRDELKKTKSQLEERKLIDRAKGILIKSKGFTEDEAYHALRKLAMERNVAIGEMAKNVIAMADLLK